MIGVQRAISLVTRAARGCCPRLALVGTVDARAVLRERLVERAAKFVEDPLPQSLGSKQSKPSRHVELRQPCFLCGRHVRETRTARLRSDRIGRSEERRVGKE